MELPKETAFIPVASEPLPKASELVLVAFELYPSATASCPDDSAAFPIATDLKSVALLFKPTAIAPLADAAAFSPIAAEIIPDAFAFDPVANEFVPDALDPYPMANELMPVASVLVPKDADWSPEARVPSPVANELMPIVARFHLFPVFFPALKAAFLGYQISRFPVETSGKEPAPLVPVWTIGSSSTHFFATTAVSDFRELVAWMAFKVCRAYGTLSSCVVPKSTTAGNPS